mmetsp:Transcript_7897/g.14342  ORF Transcript_7897/g.14342 Transcript_7897/m.14342 type:complete len:478 (+) Transcript_7897:77-1510(+)
MESSSESSESQESQTDKTTTPWRSWLLEMAVLNLVMIMWNTDNMALPAVYSEIAKSYDASPGDLASLGLVRGIFESIFALPSGFLADRLPRPLLVCIGAIVWAAGLVGCAFSPSLSWMIVFRAVNGIGLGVVQPLLFSLVADKSDERGRGRAFGFLQFSGNLGQTALTAMATSLAAYEVAAIAGWQCALLIIATLSALVGSLCGFCVTDSRGRRDKRSMTEIICEETPKLRRIMCLPTFLVIIGQGIFGTAPWFAFSYLTMWLELNCFTHSQAAGIIAFWNLGGAFSGIVGGFILDFVSRRFPDHGPPGIAQLAVFMSVPMFAIILFGLGGLDHERAGTFAIYSIIFLVTGIMISWCMVMNNKMFSDIVPAESYSYVYAADRAIEGTLGALGQPLVGWLTDGIFHFDTSRANSQDCSPDDAMRLGKGIFAVSAAAFAVCFLFYGVGHYTYPRDRKAAHQLHDDKNKIVSDVEVRESQ